MVSNLLPGSCLEWARAARPPGGPALSRRGLYLQAPGAAGAAYNHAMKAATRRTTCNRDCPDACGMVAHVKDGRVVRIGGDPEHPVTRGFLCARTSRFLERQYSRDRITRPLLRRSGKLAPVS